MITVRRLCPSRISSTPSTAAVSGRPGASGAKTSTSISPRSLKRSTTTESR